MFTSSLSAWWCRPAYPWGSITGLKTRAAAICGIRRRWNLCQMEPAKKFFEQISVFTGHLGESGHVSWLHQDLLVLRDFATVTISTKYYGQKSTTWKGLDETNYASGLECLLWLGYFEDQRWGDGWSSQVLWCEDRRGATSWSQKEKGFPTWGRRSQQPSSGESKHLPGRPWQGHFFLLTRFCMTGGFWKTRVIDVFYYYPHTPWQIILYSAGWSP